MQGLQAEILLKNISLFKANITKTQILKILRSIPKKYRYFVLISLSHCHLDLEKISMCFFSIVMKMTFIDTSRTTISSAASDVIRFSFVVRIGA